jgi:hypothetical protein
MVAREPPEGVLQLSNAPRRPRSGHEGRAAYGIVASFLIAAF